MSASNSDAQAPLSWRVKERAGFTTVEFVGEIDEHSDFAELGRGLHGSVVFNLGGVRRINSCGVREWVQFVATLPGVSDLVFTHCSPAIVNQLNMIYNFRGSAKIRSFFAPYVCERCNAEEEKLLEAQTHFPAHDTSTVPEFKCERCSNLMELDDIPERYLGFLTEG
jgi:anti-anti-sigma regulatory factor